MLGAPTQGNISAPPLEPLTTIFDYAGGSNLIYKGWAKSAQGAAVNLGAVTSFTAAAPGVLTFTVAHGFNWDGTNPTAQPTIAISGGTGNWKAANGIWIFQPTSATAGTIASVVSGTLTQLDTSTFGALAGTLVVYTVSPRTSDPVWAIQKLVYNASNALEWSGWAVNPPGAGNGDYSSLRGGSSAMQFVWDNRTKYGYC